MDHAQSSRVWELLLKGDPLANLPSTPEGRIDVRGLIAPATSVGDAISDDHSDFRDQKGNVVIRKVHWRGIDFSRARLDSLRIFDSTLENCVFDDSRCKDWRLWGTVVTGCSFRSADLRTSALGGVDDGRRNAFRSVDFSRADLRGTAYKAADFVDCIFQDTNLTKVDFATTRFERCTFAGELREVLFYRTAYQGEQFPPNEMLAVDFRRARLRYVEFRGLDLEKVSFPEDADHLVFTEFRSTLDRVIASLKGHSEIGFKKLVAYLGVYRKWAGPNQKRGVLNKQDLVEIGGEEAVAEVMRVCGQS